MIPFIRNVSEVSEILAGDKTRLRELMHPLRNDVSTSFSLAHASLKPGERSLAHKLASDELYYFLGGEGKLYVNGDLARVKEGTLALVPAGQEQWVENTASEKELVFLCIVSPYWREEGEKVTEFDQ